MWWSIPVAIGVLVFWIVVPLVMEYIADKKEKKKIHKKEDKNGK